MPAPAKRAPARPAKSRPPARLGTLPEWNLADLYAGIDDPHVKRDLDRADAESVAFEEPTKASSPRSPAVLMPAARWPRR